MADQAPLGIFQFAQRGRLAFKLLYAVLAEDSKARCVCFLDALWCHGFAYGHERDGFGAASDAARGAGDALADGIDVISDRHWKNYRRSKPTAEARRHREEQ